MALFEKRIPYRYRVRWWLEELWPKMPWVPNEGEATATVVGRCFCGFPMEEDFETKEDAVHLLQSIWNVIDNWDGSRINVEWAKGEFSVRAWAVKPAEGVDD